jgi:predicted transcriptional regulator
MSYFYDGKNIKEATKNKTVAVATYEKGSEIIVKALNFYFGDNFTRNQAVEMMNNNTANALKEIADHAKKIKMKKKELIDYLIELSEEMKAQAIVVSMRDELKFDKPKD